MELEPIPCKNLIGADVYPPTDKDRELLEAPCSPVEIKVVVIPHATDAQFHPLAINAFIDGGNGEGKSQTLVELGLVRGKQFAGLLVESSRNASFDLMGNADGRSVYGFPTEEVSGSIINGVDEILMGDSKLLIAPSGDNAVAGKSIHRNGIRVGFQKMDVGRSLDWFKVDDVGLRDVIEVDKRELRAGHKGSLCRSDNEIVHNSVI